MGDATVMERDEPEDTLQGNIIIIDIAALGGDCMYIIFYIVIFAW